MPLVYPVVGACCTSRLDDWFRCQLTDEYVRQRAQCQCLNQPTGVTAVLFWGADHPPTQGGYSGNCRLTRRQAQPIFGPTAHGRTNAATQRQTLGAGTWVQYKPSRHFTDASFRKSKRKPSHAGQASWLSPSSQRHSRTRYRCGRPPRAHWPTAGTCLLYTFRAHET